MSHDSLTLSYTFLLRLNKDNEPTNKSKESFQNRALGPSLPQFNPGSTYTS